MKDRGSRWSIYAGLGAGLVLILIVAFSVSAQRLPRVTIGIEDTVEPPDVAVGLQILFLMTVLSLAPAILIMTTSFTRIVVILHFLRQALGTQQSPPNQLLVGLSLFLTFLIMAPVWKQANDEAVQPYLKDQISAKEAFQRAMVPVRAFMLRQTRAKEIGLFFKLAKMEKPERREDVPIHVLIPAFVTSELRIAFQIGFALYVPLLIIDMIVASVLMSMGMLMLPPMMVSFPFKVMLFVLVDGWYLIIGSVVSSFH